LVPIKTRLFSNRIGRNCSRTCARLQKSGDATKTILSLVLKTQ